MLTSKRTMMVGRIRARRLVELRTGTGIDEEEARAALSCVDSENENEKPESAEKGAGEPG
jgi:hypothetical protein